MVLATSDNDVKFHNYHCDFNRITHNIVFIFAPFAQIRSPSLATVLPLALLTCLSLHPCASFKKQDIFGVYNASSKVTQTAEFSPQTKEELKLNIDACLSSSPKPSEDRATASSKVTALELAIAYAPEDLPPTKYSDRYSGFKYSGSFAGRNIEKVHALGGLDGSLKAAVTTVFKTRAVGHVLICSDLYVVQSMGSKDGSTPGMALGSCETDGPLGALAVLRAFAARGVRMSLYCDPHNGAVMRAGYEVTEV